MDALSSSSCSKLNSMAPFLPKKLLKGSHEEIQLRILFVRGFQIVLASLVQFCQPRTISPPYFPQIAPPTNLLPILIHCPQISVIAHCDDHYCLREKPSLEVVLPEDYFTHGTDGALQPRWKTSNK